MEVGFKTGPYDHYETWPTVQKEYPAMREVEYDEIPRGRVIFNVERKKYFVYSNKDVLRNFKAEIIEAFNLPVKKIKFLEDDHYFIKNDQDILLNIVQVDWKCGTFKGKNSL